MTGPGSRRLLGLGSGRFPALRLAGEVAQEALDGLDLALRLLRLLGYEEEVLHDLLHE